MYRSKDALVLPKVERPGRSFGSRSDNRPHTVAVVGSGSGAFPPPPLMQGSEGRGSRLERITQSDMKIRALNRAVSSMGLFSDGSAPGSSSDAERSLLLSASSSRHGLLLAVDQGPRSMGTDVFSQVFDMIGRCSMVLQGSATDGQSLAFPDGVGGLGARTANVQRRRSKGPAAARSCADDAEAPARVSRKAFATQLKEEVDYYLRNPEAMERAEKELDERIRRHADLRRTQQLQLRHEDSQRRCFLEENRLMAVQATKEYVSKKAKHELEVVMEKQRMALDRRAVVQENLQSRCGALELSITEKQRQAEQNASRYMRMKQLRPLQREWFGVVALMLRVQVFEAVIDASRQQRLATMRSRRGFRILAKLFLPLLRGHLVKKKIAAAAVIMRNLPRWRLNFRLRRKRRSVTMLGSALKSIVWASATYRAIRLFVFRVKLCQRIARKFLFKLRTQRIILCSLLARYHGATVERKIKSIVEQLRAISAEVSTSAEGAPGLGKKSKKGSVRRMADAESVEGMYYSQAESMLSEEDRKLVQIPESIWISVSRPFLKESKVSYMTEMDKYQSLCFNVLEKEKKRFFALQMRTMLSQASLDDEKSRRAKHTPTFSQQECLLLMRLINLPLWLDTRLLSFSYTSLRDLDDELSWEIPYSPQFWRPTERADDVITRNRSVTFDWASKPDYVTLKPRFRFVPSAPEMEILQKDAISAVKMAEVSGDPAPEGPAVGTEPC